MNEMRQKIIVFLVSAQMGHKKRHDYEKNYKRDYFGDIA